MGVPSMHSTPHGQDARATNPMRTVHTAVDAVYHSDWGRIVATLIRSYGDFDVAEESAQEAFAAAVDQWPDTGIPDAPAAWIIQTARHKAVDRLRRQMHGRDAHATS